MRAHIMDLSPVALRMRRYRARRIFERAVMRALLYGIEQQELEDLVGFVASGVQMRFHNRGRPKGNVRTLPFTQAKAAW